MNENSVFWACRYSDTEVGGNKIGNGKDLTPVLVDQRIHVALFELTNSLQVLYFEQRWAPTVEKVSDNPT